MERATFVIGDVHGMYDTLVALLSKFPKISNIVFVGDLIDRGEKSAQVVNFVRENGYKCVQGNHEATFIQFFRDYFNGANSSLLEVKWHSWLYYNGGFETLVSYDFYLDKKNSESVIKQIKSDYLWMQSLPYYLELETTHKSNLPVIVSHSNITNVWHLRESKKDFATFKETLQRTRNLDCNSSAEIINIYGHTPQSVQKKHKNCINVDSGCCFYKYEGYGKLSAYWIENDKIITQRAIV